MGFVGWGNSSYGGPTAQPAAPSVSPGDQHLIASFLSLDPGARAQSLARLNTAARSDPGAAQRLSLLTPHLSKPYTPAPNYQDSSIGGKVYRFDQGMNKTNQPVKKAAKWLGGQAYDLLVQDAKRGGQSLTRMVSGGKYTDLTAANMKQLANKGNYQVTTDKSPISKKQFLSDFITTGMNGADFAGGLAFKGAKVGLEDIAKFGAKNVAKAVFRDAGKGMTVAAGLSALNAWGAGDSGKKITHETIKGGLIGLGFGGLAGGIEGRAGLKAAVGARAKLAERAAEDAKPKGLPAGPTRSTTELPAGQQPKGLPERATPSGEPVRNESTKTTPATPASSKTVPVGDQEFADRFNAISKSYDQQYKAAEKISAPLKRQAVLNGIDKTHAAALEKLQHEFENGKANPNYKEGTPAKTEKTGFIVHTDASGNRIVTTTKRIATIDRKLSAFHAGKSDLSAQDAKGLMKERTKLVKDRTDNALGKIATKHSNETGQPVEAAHATIKQGLSRYGDDYRQAKAEGKQLKNSAPQPQPKPKVEPTKDAGPNRLNEAQKQGGMLRQAYHTARGFFGAVSASKLSREAAQGLSEARAKADNAAEILRSQEKTALKFFSKKSDEENIANISHYERHGSFANEPAKGYSKVYQSTMDKVHEVMARAFGDDKVGYVDNYVRRNFQFKNPDQAKAATNILLKRFGSKSPTKGRALDMPLEDALKTMRDAGYDVKPITTNPEELRQWSLINAHRVQAYQQEYERQIKTGLISTTAKAGMVPVKREVIQALVPKMAGVEHFTFPEVNRILNRATEPGLASDPLYKLVRRASAGLGQVTLAVPSFHATMTTANALAGEVANTILQATRGQVLGAVKSAALSSTIVGPAIKNFVKGNSAMKLAESVRVGEFGPPNEVLRLVNQGGAKLGMSHEMSSGATATMLKLFSDHGIVSKAKGAALLPFSAAEQIAKPLMQEIIPRIKLGAYVDRAAQIQARGLGEQETKNALAALSNSIDNRLGEVVMSNKYWNPIIRDLAQVAYLSVGYRSGTVGELGGGIVDTVGKNWLKNGLSERQAFLIGVPLAAAYTGAIYQYLHTGQMPKNISEAIYPKNGQKDVNGNDQRVQMPSYVKDLAALVTNPIKEIGPTAPGVKLISSIMSNKDYKGDLIRNPNDSPEKQAEQMMKYIRDQSGPIVAQNQVKAGAKNQNPSLQQRAEVLFGVNNAPKSVTESPMDKLIYQLKGPSAPRTPEQTDTANLKQQVLADVKAGKNPQQSKAYGPLAKSMSPSSLKTFLATTKDSPMQYDFDHLKDSQKVQVILKSSPQDLKTLKFDNFVKGALTNDSTAKSLQHDGVTVDQFNAALKKVGVDPNNKKQMEYTIKRDSRQQSRLQTWMNRGKPKYVNPYAN